MDANEIVAHEVQRDGSPAQRDVAGVTKVQDAIEGSDQTPEDNPCLGTSIVEATKDLRALKRKTMNPAEIVDHLEAGAYPKEQ